MSDIFEQAQIINLDNIPDSAIISGTVDGKRTIFNKEQLFAKLGRRRRDAKVKKASPAKPVKS